MATFFKPLLILTIVSICLASTARASNDSASVIDGTWLTKKSDSLRINNGIIVFCISGRAKCNTFVVRKFEPLQKYSHFLFASPDGITITGRYYGSRKTDQLVFEKIIDPVLKKSVGNIGNLVFSKKVDGTGWIYEPANSKECRPNVTAWTPAKELKNKEICSYEKIGENGFEYIYCCTFQAMPLGNAEGGDMVTALALYAKDKSQCEKGRLQFESGKPEFYQGTSRSRFFSCRASELIGKRNYLGLNGDAIMKVDIQAEKMPQKLHSCIDQQVRVFFTTNPNAKKIDTKSIRTFFEKCI